EERAWQLGVLRAVGLRTGAVWRSLVGESLLVGAAGVAVGIPLGLGLGRLLVPVIATASAVAQKLVAPPATLALEPGPLLLGGAASRGARRAVRRRELPPQPAPHRAHRGDARRGARVRGVVLDDGGELPQLARHRAHRGGARRPRRHLGARDQRLRRGTRERGA